MRKTDEEKATELRAKLAKLDEKKARATLAATPWGARLLRMETLARGDWGDAPPPAHDVDALRAAVEAAVKAALESQS